MTFRPRLRTALRDSLLDGLRTRFAASGHRLLATPRSWVYRLADALGVELEGLEAVAGELVREVFPTTATEEGVARHAGVLAMPRRPAVSAHLRVRVMGPASSTVAIPEGRKLSTSQGASFTPAGASADFDAGGAGYLEVVADAAGEGGNLAEGVTLVWSSAPAGFGPSATVARRPGDASAIVSAGEDQELVSDWALRIVDRLRERPATGNRADWRDWIEGVDGVGEAYVYPRTDPAGFVADTLGCVTAIALAPKPSSYAQLADGTLSDGLAPWRGAPHPRSLRALSGDVLGRVAAFVRGEVDARGAAVPEVLRRERYAANMDPSDWSVIGARAEAMVSVVAQVRPDPALYPWPFLTPVPINAATSNTLTFTEVDYVAAGFATGHRIALPLGELAVRGGFWLATITAANPVTFTLNVSPPMPVVPAHGLLVYPDCGLWDEIRRRLLALYDDLGPAPFDGGTSQRYPPESYRGPATLFQSRLYATVADTPGVLGVSIVAPGVPSVTPMPGAIVVPGTVRIDPMP